jgi:hypothetical protein
MNAKQIAEQIGTERDALQQMMEMGFSARTIERQERKINDLKAEQMRCGA